MLRRGGRTARLLLQDRRTHACSSNSDLSPPSVVQLQTLEERVLSPTASPVRRTTTAPPEL